MISIEHFEAARLCDLKDGALFISIGGQPIVAGTTDGVPVFVILTPAQKGREPFEFFPQQDQPRRGYMYPEVHFEADETSATVVGPEHQLEIGQLVRFNGGYGMYAYGRVHAGSLEQERGLVELKGVFSDGKEPQHFLAFSRWRIVIREGDGAVPVFAYERPQAS